MGTCKVKTQEKEFEPITFEVTVENEDELKWLWHAFNINDYGCQNKPPEEASVSIPNANNVHTRFFWNTVNDIVIKLGLRKKEY